MATARPEKTDSILHVDNYNLMYIVFSFSSRLEMYSIFVVCYGALCAPILLTST